MFERMLSHPRVSVSLNRAFCPESLDDMQGCDFLIYTGPIDRFFQCCFGPLPYRSLTFEHLYMPDVIHAQPAAVINYPNDHAFTRVTEWKQLTGQECAGTSLTREYPTEVGEPFYPVPNPCSQALLARYRKLAQGLDRVAFIGRLAEYRYYNMDQAVASALSKAQAIAEKLGLKQVDANA